MRLFLLLLLLSIPDFVFCLENSQEKTIQLQYRTAEDIIPYLKPHLSEDGRITGQDKSITIKSTKTNIDELFIIIGDLDRSDYKQIIISITMNVKAVHNINTRSIQVGANTWTKINYGITYSKRIRETLPNGKLVEKIKYVKVIESFQIHTKVDDTNHNVNLQLRLNQDYNENDDSFNTETENILEIDSIEVVELTENNLVIKIDGELNKWINLGDAVNSLYISSDENLKIQRERKQLTNKLGIKIQLLE